MSYIKGTDGNRSSTLMFCFVCILFEEYLNMRKMNVVEDLFHMLAKTFIILTKKLHFSKIRIDDLQTL